MRFVPVTCIAGASPATALTMSVKTTTKPIVRIVGSNVIQNGMSPIMLAT